MTCHYDEEGELVDRSQIPEPHRTVLLVYHCQGMIGNGGFRVLLEGKFTGDPRFELTKQSFRQISATSALAAWDRMESIFPDSRIPLNIDERLAIWDSNFSRFDDDTPDTMYFAAMDETGNRLRDFVDTHISEFKQFT